MANKKLDPITMEVPLPWSNQPMVIRVPFGLSVTIAVVAIVGALIAKFVGL